MYVWKDYNYASLAVSFSFIVHKIKRRYRISSSQIFFKIGVLKNFAKSYWKTPALESLSNKVAGS